MIFSSCKFARFFVASLCSMLACVAIAQQSCERSTYFCTYPMPPLHPHGWPGLPTIEPQSPLEAALLKPDFLLANALLQKLDRDQRRQLAVTTTVLKTALEKGQKKVFSALLEAVPAYSDLPHKGGVGSLVARSDDVQLVRTLMAKGWNPLVDGDALREASCNTRRVRPSAVWGFLLELAARQPAQLQELGRIGVLDCVFATRDLALISRYLDVSKLDLNKGTSDQSPAVFYAPPDPAVLEFLRTRGADLSAANTWRYSGQGTLLHKFALHANVPDVIAYLLKQGLHPNDLRGSDDAPLTLAARVNDVASARLMLDAGADINHVSGRNAVTALSAAMTHGGQNLDVFEVLLLRGANPWALREMREHPAPADNTLATRLLPRFLGTLPASREGLFDKLLTLKPANQSLDQLDPSGLNALHYAAMARNSFAAAKLLRAGAQPDVKTFAQDPYAAPLGATALHLAILATPMCTSPDIAAEHQGQLAMARVLLGAGASRAARDSQGCTPTTYLKRTRRDEPSTWLELRKLLAHPN